MQTDDEMLLLNLSARLDQVKAWIAEVAAMVDEVEKHGYQPGDDSPRGQQLQQTISRLLHIAGYR